VKAREFIGVALRVAVNPPFNKYPGEVLSACGPYAPLVEGFKRELHPWRNYLGLKHIRLLGQVSSLKLSGLKPISSWALKKAKKYLNCAVGSFKSVKQT